MCDTVRVHGGAVSWEEDEREASIWPEKGTPLLKALKDSLFFVSVNVVGMMAYVALLLIYPPLLFLKLPISDKNYPLADAITSVYYAVLGLSFFFVATR